MEETIENNGNQTENTKKSFNLSKLFTILRVLILILIALGVISLAYEFHNANTAVRELLINGNGQPILDFYNEYSGTELICLEKEFNLELQIPTVASNSSSFGLSS